MNSSNLASLISQGTSLSRKVVINRSHLIIPPPNALLSCNILHQACATSFSWHMANSDFSISLAPIATRTFWTSSTNYWGFFTVLDRVKIGRFILIKSRILFAMLWAGGLVCWTSFLLAWAVIAWACIVMAWFIYAKAVRTSKCWYLMMKDYEHSLYIKIVSCLSKPCCPYMIPDW